MEIFGKVMYILFWIFSTLTLGYLLGVGIAEGLSLVPKSPALIPFIFLGLGGSAIFCFLVSLACERLSKKAE